MFVSSGKDGRRAGGAGSRGEKSDGEKLAPACACRRCGGDDVVWRRDPCQRAKPKQSSGGIETVVVTAQKRSENIQKVPIEISAFTQKELKTQQIAGGPDLIKEVPNLTFSKTNFTGYNIQIRGIGTQAISVTTDPAVAIAFNNIPFIRNHFFEQESSTSATSRCCAGRRARCTAATRLRASSIFPAPLPADQYEANASVDVGNFNERRLEGMVNIPLVEDRLALRVAGEQHRSAATPLRPQ